MKRQLALSFVWVLPGVALGLIFGLLLMRPTTDDMPATQQFCSQGVCFPTFADEPTVFVKCNPNGTPVEPKDWATTRAIFLCSSEWKR